MGTKHGKLVVVQEDYDRLVECCADGYVCDSDGIEYDAEYRFPDGIRMAVQVCKARGESCWTQGVLFDADGNELGCTDCSDGIETEFAIEYEGTNYCVEVVAVREPTTAVKVTAELRSKLDEEERRWSHHAELAKSYDDDGDGPSNCQNYLAGFRRARQLIGI